MTDMQPSALWFQATAPHFVSGRNWEEGLRSIRKPPTNPQTECDIKQAQFVAHRKSYRHRLNIHDYRK